jgi:hypothetical protein
MDVVESLAEKFIEFLIAYIPGARPDLTSLADNIVSQALCLRLSGPACGRYAFMLIVSSLETARPNQGSTISRSSPAKSLAPLLGPAGKSLGYAIVTAKAGDSVALFGVGFGPTGQPAPAGDVYSTVPAISALLTPADHFSRPRL